MGGAGAAGVYYEQGLTQPAMDSGSTLMGEPRLAASSVYDDSIRYVFGVSLQELRAMADSHVETDVDFPDVVNGGLTLMDGDMTFNAKKLEAYNTMSGTEREAHLSELKGKAGSFKGRRICQVQ